MTTTSAGVSRRLPGRTIGAHDARDAIFVRDALLVAAPASAVDPLTPWVEPVTRGDRAVSTTFWMGFHGLSAFAHTVAIVLCLAGTLVPIPLLASMCGDVKPVEKIPERVELAVVEAPKPIAPPPPVLALAEPVMAGEGVALKSCHVDEDCADNEACVDHVCVAAARKHKNKTPKKKGHARKKRDDDVAVYGVLAALSSDNSAAFADLLTAAPSEGDSLAMIGGVEGGVVGGTVGYGGLGLRGSGTGGGTGESVGLGHIGTIGGGGTGAGFGSGRLVGQAEQRPPAQVEPQPQIAMPPPRPVTLVVDGKPVDQPAVARMLASCHVDGTVRGTLKVGVGGRPDSVTSKPANPCVERRLKMALRLVDFEMSDVPYEVAPR